MCNLLVALGMNHDVFISYSSKNSAAAQAICHELEDNGVKCWMAPRDIPVGAKYASVITKAIVGCRIVVLVFSDDSARSPWVESEINIAFSNRKTIVPYKIDTTNIEDFDEFYLMLNNRHWIEAYPDYKTRFKELVTIVAQALGKTLPVEKVVADDVPTPTPTPTPISKLNNLKKYWWVFFCVLVLGVMVWNFLPEENGDEFNIDSIVDINGREGDSRVKEESWGKSEEVKTSQSAKNTATTSDKKVDLESGQSMMMQKFEEEGAKHDKGYLLNLSDREFVRFGKDDKYGFKLKSTGEVVILTSKYSYVGDFCEGLARVYEGERTDYQFLGGKFGYIDKTGKEVIPLKYDDTWSFSEGLAAVKLNGKWGYIDKTGKEVTPLKYDSGSDFSEGLAAVKLNGKSGFIDKTGKVVIPLKYDDAWDFSEGLAKVKLNGKSGYIDKTGKVVIPLKYDIGSDFSEGLAWVKLNGKSGFIDKTDKEVISFKYDVARSFSEGLAKIGLNGKYGFIDKTGKEVIPLKYDDAWGFEEGLAAVELNEKWGFIDKIGKEVIPLKYDFAASFSEGLAYVSINGKYGFVDKTGKEVIALKYDNANSFYNGKAKVELNGEEFYIDKRGNRIE